MTWRDMLRARREVEGVREGEREGDSRSNSISVNAGMRVRECVECEMYMNEYSHVDWHLEYLDSYLPTF